MFVCLVESFPKKNYVTRTDDRWKRFLEVLINYSSIARRILTHYVLVSGGVCTCEWRHGGM